MNKFLFFVFCLPIVLQAQVGINVSSPVATLDVVAKTSGTSPTVAEGMVAPRLSRSDLIAKENAYTSEHIGVIVYVLDETGVLTVKTANIVSPGYYYFDGSLWQNISTSSKNIYNSDGLLTGNRVISMGNNTVTWENSAADANTVSVKANNLTTGNAFSISTPELTTGSAINIESANNSTNANGIVKVINTKASSDGKFLTFQANSSTDSGLHILNNGYTGIGSSLPTATLHVNGSGRITDTPLSTNINDNYLVVDATGNIKSRSTSVSRFGQLLLNGTTDMSAYLPSDVKDFYFVDKTHTLTLPNVVTNAGKLIRFYLYGGTGGTFKISPVYGPTEPDTSVVPSGFSYSKTGVGATLTITGQINRFNFIDVISDGQSWWVDNRN